jgi:hypothetical protein
LMKTKGAHRPTYNVNITYKMPWANLNRWQNNIHYNESTIPCNSRTAGSVENLERLRATAM